MDRYRCNRRAPFRLLSAYTAQLNVPSICQATDVRAKKFLLHVTSGALIAFALLLFVSFAVADVWYREGTYYSAFLCTALFLAAIGAILTNRRLLAGTPKRSLHAIGIPLAFPLATGLLLRESTTTNILDGVIVLIPVFLAAVGYSFAILRIQAHDV